MGNINEIVTDNLDRKSEVWVSGKRRGTERPGLATLESADIEGREMLVVDKEL